MIHNYKLGLLKISENQVLQKMYRKKEVCPWPLFFLTRRPNFCTEWKITIWHFSKSKVHFKGEPETTPFCCSQVSVTSLECYTAFLGGGHQTCTSALGRTETWVFFGKQRKLRPPTIVISGFRLTVTDFRRYPS